MYDKQLVINKIVSNIYTTYLNRKQLSPTRATVFALIPRASLKANNNNIL